MDNIIKMINNKKYYDDLYDIPRNLFMNKKILPKHSKNMNIALLNVPCGGFGDVIICKIFYEYLKNWYKNVNVYICTNDIDKFKEIKSDVKNMIHLKEKKKEDCHSFYNLSIKTKIKFDIMIVVPVVKRTFFIEELQSMIPYASRFNTFTVSEYNNNLLGPYTFSTGVGKHNQGIFLTDMNNIKKHDLIKSPYALIYIQPPGPESTGSWGVHGNYCFLSFIEMISKKYNHKLFQVIVPDWIADIIRCYLEKPQSGTCYTVNKRLKEYTKNYPNLLMIDEYGQKFTIKSDKKSDNTMIIRGDILPKSRPDFISLIKYSVDDVLLTGDQSITDTFSCCSKKIIWYQIAPWKKDFATEMSKHIPNKYFKSYKTSCGTLNALDYTPDYSNFLKKFDFRTKGKTIMDAIILSIYYKDDKVLSEFKNIVDNSYTINSVKNKLIKKKKQTGGAPGDGNMEDIIEALRLLDVATDEMNSGNMVNARANFDAAIKLAGKLPLADALVDRGIHKMANREYLSAEIDFESALELDPEYTLAQDYLDTIMLKRIKAGRRLAFLHQVSYELPADVSERVARLLGQ